MTVRSIAATFFCNRIYRLLRCAVEASRCGETPHLDDAGPRWERRWIVAGPGPAGTKCSGASLDRWQHSRRSSRRRRLRGDRDCVDNQDDCRSATIPRSTHPAGFRSIWRVFVSTRASNRLRGLAEFHNEFRLSGIPRKISLTRSRRLQLFCGDIHLRIAVFRRSVPWKRCFGSVASGLREGQAGSGSVRRLDTHNKIRGRPH